ncbi:MAG: hypothetical protein M3128_12005 [Verrucomicrobiota bacterium]|nr:hypothetical protein [Verrucomicrobiota bacterium]
MAAEARIEFRNLCAAILDDGEVTAAEAYRITEWLNAHPDVVSAFPTQELIEPLRRIWKDGVANRRELERLARLIVRLQRTGSDDPAQLNETDNTIELPFFAALEAGVPRLPRIQVRRQIETYEVNLDGPSCSCSNWSAQRSQLPIGHLTRCCQHIFLAYAQLPQITAANDWLASYFELGWPVTPPTEWELVAIDKEKVLISTASDKGWANVFAKDEKLYKRFNYHLKEHRWAYDSVPRWEWVITDAIRSLTSATARTL